ncbi:RraA family protein [Streptomyces griseoloalbus]|uniref:RraA family protein n=1 Tax=Streptomyces griseoloalbus TaxID=67303 RepID=A0ABV3EG80_9ACTN
MSHDTHPIGRPTAGAAGTDGSREGALVAELAALGSAALVDAMGRVHRHRTDVLPLVSPCPERVLFEGAATVSFMPWRDDVEEASKTFADLFCEAVGDDPSGRVLVLSSGGHPQVSHGGGTKLSRVANHRLAGVLADGRLRNFRQLRGYEFATWCRGESTRWGGDTVMPYAANTTVEFAGGVHHPRGLRVL